VKKLKRSPWRLVVPGLVAFILSISGCWFSSTTEVPSQTDRRHVSLDGQSNFRDIGGYKTVGGKTVRWGQIYRSGELPRLSDKDVAELEKLGIATTVNFLTEDEIEARGKDRLPTGVREIALPISGKAEQDLAKVVLQARQTADFSRVPVELNPEVHRLLVWDAAMNCGIWRPKNKGFQRIKWI